LAFPFRQAIGPQGIRQGIDLATVKIPHLPRKIRPFPPIEKKLKKSLDIHPDTVEYRRVKDKIINQTNGSSEPNITYKGRNDELGTPQANAEKLWRGVPISVHVEGFLRLRLAEWGNDLGVWDWATVGSARWKCLVVQAGCGRLFVDYALRRCGIARLSSGWFYVINLEARTAERIVLKRWGCDGAMVHTAFGSRIESVKGGVL